MERLPSLINSLKTSFEAGKSNAELLNLLEEIRKELTGSRPASNEVQSRVSVWLPAGYQPLPEMNIPAAETLVALEQVENAQVSAPFISGSLLDSIQMESSFEQLNGKNEMPAPRVNGVPRPPQVTIMDEPESPRRETEVKKEEGIPEFFLPGNLTVQANRKPGDVFEALNVNSAHDDETPVVVELNLNGFTEEEMPEGIKQNPSPAIPDGFLTTAKAAEVMAKPRELHEILANRVVAQTGSAEAARPPKVLADKLSGGKIHDLRKGISINDRFRFIQSLFRADDSLFERSVKTINNFSILQEAQYWIQRELVIKLGWNEEDELVQAFYQLVSRRFM